ncbi:hypothetical protein [Halobacterium wangiae]|uniref:hypothetical protein n=1 Tax=Halobacterium wangiae TaxID=2902623 RepID=UPI001E491ECE|nr:hypothetical protein [Halobacterium wangiae]
MSDSPSSDVHGTETRPTTPETPLFVGLTLWRESVVAAVGLLSLLTGAHGWTTVLGGALSGWGYTPLNLLLDLGWVVLGVYLLVGAAGSAARRLARA